NITNISIAIDNYSGDSLVSYDIASSIPASSGSYSWRVGSTLSGTAINPGTQYKILIYGVADSTNADPIKVKDYSNNYFNIISPIQPAITSILPTSGPAGTVVTMTGSGFGTLNTIDFGTVKIPNIPSPDSTTLTFAIPSSLSANSYNFNIINTTDNFTSNLSTFTVTSAISAKFSNNGLASISDAFFKIATGIQTLFGR
ncbi:MAG: IPT/TIG domain-containing protein, partial [Candidatus Staskawiczbacteria bacterium]|nr:IPT/TIG domain-containing protein [Candidatus Staskawiczbacteria bacterium]